jgi:hypothetical protein
VLRRLVSEITRKLGARGAGACRPLRGSWPRHGLLIREGGICFASPDAARKRRERRSEPTEGLLDVEVDAEEQKRPQNDGQQRRQEGLERADVREVMV